MPMLSPVYAGITSFLLSFAFLPFIIRFSKNKRLVSHPGERRIHKRVTPSLGGVAIFFGFTVSGICWAIQTRPSVIFQLLPILIIPFIIGLLDDLIHLKPLAKLIAQCITASLIFLILNLGLTSDYGLLGGLNFSLPISYSATLFTVVLITNSLNLIDGIDGLAATFSLLACVFFGGWFFLIANYQFAIICIALAGAILAFLFQNWEPSNIFMGDTGSLVIGTILSVVMIQFINEDFSLQTNHPMKFNSSIGTAICAMIIPLTDTTRIIIIRLRKGISPLKADKRHIHHALVRLGSSQRQAVYILTLAHVGIIGLAVILRKCPEWVLLGTILLVTLLLSFILERQLSKSLKKETSEDRSREG